ncbi:Carbohydrate sulfotransferase 15 [Holothuria leucospilota]|uniref:Carbohydrate sulfotransferase 15 n=1 Tax=Holothuria leucospilota TaxID=206669 RepID=A0A9Q0YKL1_HOLLE|nr:Carbohydrate sulfotransferase 15 [Holothuria leucospilota]
MGNTRFTVLRTDKLILLGHVVDGEGEAHLGEEDAHNARHILQDDKRKHSNESNPSNREIPLGTEWEIFNSSKLSSSPIGLGPASQISSIKGQQYFPGKELNSLQQKQDEKYPRTKEKKSSGISAEQVALYGDSINTSFTKQPFSYNWRNLPTELYRLAPFVFDTVPKQFAPEFRNPCWYAPDKQLLCLPHFYLLGFPKCGTTDLWYKINNHPKVAKTRRKETHYWTCDGSASTFHTHWKFIEENQNITNGEFMYTKVDIIKELTPKAKMIIAIREPVEREIIYTLLPLATNDKYLRTFCKGLGGRLWIQSGDGDKTRRLESELSVHFTEDLRLSRTGYFKP